MNIRAYIDSDGSLTFSSTDQAFVEAFNSMPKGYEDQLAEKLETFKGQTATRETMSAAAQIVKEWIAAKQLYGELELIDGQWTWTARP